ncbi:hypothetical protein BDV98DRAFT_196301 [Pterulicium gracile]|uniref:Uncharacterized protein n=1 Tax=Pterulicium gracile TaxID=1884261 RepID=A0A5C3QEI2_9AGAR|nr:hypothetical protein BDV98DRAFT_196301 [Pterula gracilis]
MMRFSSYLLWQIQYSLSSSLSASTSPSIGTSSSGGAEEEALSSPGATDADLERGGSLSVEDMPGLTGRDFFGDGLSDGESALWWDEATAGVVITFALFEGALAGILLLDLGDTVGLEA